MTNYLLHAAVKTWVMAVPDPEPVPPPGIAEKVNTILGFILYLVIAACVVGVMIVGAKLALAHRRGELHDHLAGLMAVGAGCVLAGGASGLVNFLM
jgi:hypothetical protein